MEELRKEFEKEILYCAMAIVNHTNEHVGTSVEKRQQTNDVNFDFGILKIKEFLEQKLSKKQVTERTEFKLLHEYCDEKEFKMFMLKVYDDWRNNPDKTAIDYMLEQIFSHYTLIPKED